MTAKGKQIRIPGRAINPSTLLGPHGPQEPPANSTKMQTPPAARTMSADRINFDTGVSLALQDEPSNNPEVTAKYPLIGQNRISPGFAQDN